MKTTSNSKKNLPNLGNDSIPKLIWTFAIPGIISQVMTAVYNLVDQIFIGRGIEPVAIAATNIAMPLTSIITAVAALIGMGAAANFNLAMGKGEKEVAGKTFGNSIIYLSIIGLVIGIIAFIFLEPMLRAFGATDGIIHYAIPYARIICLGLPFGIFSTGVSYLIRADGNPNFSMLILLFGAIFNLIADPIFLFVFKMGIGGIALATAMGQLLSSIIGIYYLTKKVRTLPLKKEYFSIRFSLLGNILLSGSAIFTTHICAFLVQIVQNNSFKIYGAMSVYGSDIPLAAVGAANKVFIVLMSTVIGVALGCQPIIGFNYGHKSFDRVKKTYFLAIKYTAIVSITAFLLMQIFPVQIMSLFGSGNKLFFEFATKYIHIYLLLLFAGGVLPVTSTFFTAIGKAKIGMYLTLLKQAVLLIPLTIILPKFAGVIGVLAAGPITDSIILIVVIILAVKEIKSMNISE